VPQITSSRGERCFRADPFLGTKKEQECEMSLPKVFDVPTGQNASEAGDLRGHYGFGRPAHGADPDAKYGFEAETDPAHALASETHGQRPVHDLNRQEWEEEIEKALGT
jgi:hypothetical protein